MHKCKNNKQPKQCNCDPKCAGYLDRLGLGTFIKPHKAYAILALFFGILFVFFAPPFYVQDEVSHFYRIYQLADGHLFGEKERSNFYLISVPTINSDNAAPNKWTSKSPMLVKDQQNNVYIYAFKDLTWKYTKLDSSLFRGIDFPQIGKTPIFLKEQDKHPEIYAEILKKGALYPTALYQAGDFLPQSIVETTMSLMHHLPFIQDNKINNRLPISKVYALFSQQLNPDVRIFMDFNNTTLYAPFSYLPQVGGLLVGKLLNLPPVTLLYLARLCALLCSITLVYYALKIIPIMKWSMFLLALMPLTFWETSSASYDNLTISLSFLLTAIFFYYAFSKTKIRAPDLLTVFVLTSLVSLSKTAYLPLIFLYFLIPISKIGSKGKYLTMFLLLLLANVTLAGIWSVLVQKLYVPYLYNLNIDPSLQLLYLWLHPLQIFSLVWRYLATFDWSNITQFVGVFGYLVEPQGMLFNFYALVIFAVPFFESQQTLLLTARQKCIIGGVFLLNFFVVFLLIYLSSTEISGHAIIGMRMRYFLPFCILFFSLFQQRIALHNLDIEYYKSHLLPLLAFIILIAALFTARFYYS